VAFFREGRIGFQDFGYLLKLTYGGSYLGGVSGAFWFITCLFLTQQIYNIISARFSERSLHLIVLFAYVTSLADSLAGGSDFPWAANVSLCAVFFFHVGFLLKTYPVAFQLIRSRWSVVIFLFVLGFLVTWDLPYAMDMKSANYGIPILTPVLAVVCSMFAFELSKEMTQWEGLKWLLIPIGRASMTILFLHQFCQYAVFIPIGLSSKALVLLLSIIVPVWMHLLLQRFRVTRFLFLGG
jgi:fucose 4-O-acetylase-like acetyltransferase